MWWINVLDKIEEKTCYSYNYHNVTKKYIIYNNMLLEKSFDNKIMYIVNQI